MDQIEAARQFLSGEGRDIDQARFAYHFGDGAQEDLVQVLTRYQNPDGGFGHGLEVDISAPASNPFATEIALGMCLVARVPADHPVVAGIVAWLEETQDEEGCWRFAPGVYQHRLAPWYQHWTWPTLNPSCPLAGLLRSYGLGSTRLHQRVAALFDRLAKPDDLLGDEYYAVRPYAFYFLPESDLPQRELYLGGVAWWLIRQQAEGRQADAAHFFEYVQGPATSVGRLLPHMLVDAQLQALAAEQADDGGWPSPYDPRWRAPTTVQNLLTLLAFGRLG